MDLRMKSRIARAAKAAAKHEADEVERLQEAGELSVYRGVRPLHNGRFRASVKHQKTTYYAGMHEKERHAAGVHDDLCSKLHLRHHMNSAAGLSTWDYDDDPSKKQYKTRFEGVSRNGTKLQWTAKLRFRGTTYYLGCHDSIMKASRIFDEEAIKRGVRERRAVQAHPQLPPGGIDQLREWQRDWTAEQIRHHKRKKDRYRAVIKTHV